MSHILVKQVWRSQAPLFLKRGILGALAFLANDDGTFLTPPTVKVLTEHDHYPDGRRRRKRIVQYQLRLCEKLRVWSAQPHVGGRGIVRQSMLHPDAIPLITAAAVLAAEYAKGATARKGATAAKGATKGATATRQRVQRRPDQDLDLRKEKNALIRTAKYAPAALAEKGRPTAELKNLNSADLWTQLQHRMAVQLRRWDYGTYVSPMRLLADRQDVLQVQGWLPGAYAALLEQAAQELRPGVQIEFVRANGRRD